MQLYFKGGRLRRNFILRVFSRPLGLSFSRSISGYWRVSLPPQKPAEPPKYPSATAAEVADFEDVVGGHPRLGGDRNA